MNSLQRSYVNQWHHQQWIHSIRNISQSQISYSKCQKSYLFVMEAISTSKSWIDRQPIFKLTIIYELLPFSHVFVQFLFCFFQFQRADIPLWITGKVCVIIHASSKVSRNLIIVCLCCVSLSSQCCQHHYLCISPGSWGSEIHWLHLSRGGWTPLLLLKKTKKQCPVYYIKPSEGGSSAVELWGIEVPLHCHCFQVHSGPEWLHLIGSYL